MSPKKKMLVLVGAMMLLLFSIVPKFNAQDSWPCPPFVNMDTSTPEYNRSSLPPGATAVGTYMRYWGMQTCYIASAQSELTCTYYTMQ